MGHFTKSRLRYNTATDTYARPGGPAAKIERRNAG